MGFASALKNSLGASYGMVESPDFPNCILSSKSNADIEAGNFYIDKGAIEPGKKFERYEFNKSDIALMRFVGCGGTWVRYYIRFKDGKCCFVTGDVQSPAEKSRHKNDSAAGSVVYSMPLERFFGDIISFR